MGIGGYGVTAEKGELVWKFCIAVNSHSDNKCQGKQPADYPKKTFYNKIFLLIIILNSFSFHSLLFENFILQYIVFILKK